MNPLDKSCKPPLIYCITSIYCTVLRGYSCLFDIGIHKGSALMTLL